MLLYQILAHTIHGKTKKFELPDGSDSVSGIQEYFEYIIKKYEAATDNPPIRIYVNKTENSITFRINTEHYLELLTLEMMKLLESTKSKITKNENDESVLHLEITEVVLLHCNMFNSDHKKIQD